MILVGHSRYIVSGRRLLLVFALSVLLPAACGVAGPPASAASQQSGAGEGGRPRLALWLAKKDELLACEDAGYDLVMSGWFDPGEAGAVKSRRFSAKLLAGLSLTWIMDDPEWREFLLAAANGGDPGGHLQITDDMYLMRDEDHDGILDSRCSPPGWDNIYAMDPRHPGWRRLILSFYENVAAQPQHDGVIVDMVDAYPFCDGCRSVGVQTPIDAASWVSAQDEMLGLIRRNIPAGKWIIANAGRDFPAGSPFPPHLNGYLLENFLGSWGAGLEEGLASAGRALETTQAPHIVVFAVDTDDTGKINWHRFRTGFAASLLMDNTYFAFDYGSRDHGGVGDWWFPVYYGINLGRPLGPYTEAGGVYRRGFARGMIVVAAERDACVSFDTPHVEAGIGAVGLEFTVPKGDAGIFLAAD